MNALTPIQQPELVATLSQARALLDDGDMALALKLSSVVYDQAKAAGDAAEKVKASFELIGKARRLQGEALRLESMCSIAMANAVDDARAAGTLSRQGRPEKARASGVFTLEDLGVTSQRLSEARKLRNQVLAEPDFIDRVVEVRLADGLEPTRASIRHAIGTRSASNEDKGDQLYETPAEATRTLIAIESFSRVFKEPAVGRGAILRVLEAAGYEGEIADLRDRCVMTAGGVAQGVGDFLESWPGESCGMDIVTNPPYGDVANAFLAHALRVHKPGKMAALLNLNFMCGFEDADRRFILDENPPSRVYVFARRLPMMHRDGWDGKKSTSQMNTGWFVWERNADGSYGSRRGSWETIRVDWADFQDAEPMPPGVRLFLTPDEFPEAEEDFERSTPRKTTDERVQEDYFRAAHWVDKAAEPFDHIKFRQGVAVRDSVAVGLLVAFEAAGLIERIEGEADAACWRSTGNNIVQSELFS